MTQEFEGNTAEEFVRELSEDIEFKPKYERACKVLMEKEKFITKLLVSIGNLKTYADGLEDQNEILKIKVTVLKEQRSDLFYQLQDLMDKEKEKL